MESTLKLLFNIMPLIDKISSQVAEHIQRLDDHLELWETAEKVALKDAFIRFSPLGPNWASFLASVGSSPGTAMSWRT